MSKKQLPAWAVLMIITLVAALCLGGTYEMTKDTIAQRTAAEAEATRKALLPDASVFEQVEDSQLDSLYVGKTGEGDDAQAVGYVGVTTVQGFGGDVEVTVGTDTSGTLTGIRVGGENFSETAGLGARAKDAAFTDQFKGKTPTLKLGSSANENEIDALTSSTITSNAVVRGVNSAWKSISGYAGFSSGEETLVANTGDGFVVQADGLTGTFDVTVKLDEGGAVAGVSLGEASTDADAAFLKMVKDSGTFLAQFNGRSGEISASDIDMVSGATTSSKGVLAAVNTVLGNGSNPAAAEAAPAETANVSEPSVDGNTVSADGLTGTFDVTVQLDESGAVANVNLGEASTDADAAFLKMVKDSGTFLPQFIGKSGEIAEADIDMVTGATTSSKGVLAAVNTVLRKGSTAAAAEGAPAETANVSEPSLDGKTVTANGLTGTFDVTVQLDESGAVANVNLGEASTDADAPFLKKVKDSGTFLSQFVGKNGGIAEADIDMVTGATTSSKAVVAAVNSLIGGTAAGELPRADAAQERAGVRETADGGYLVTANGKTGTFDVTVFLDKDGTVTEVRVGDASNEDDVPYVLMLRIKESFLPQFVGKAGEIAESEIDSVTYATLSSGAVLDAVNEVLSHYAAAAAARMPVEKEDGSFGVTAAGKTGTFDVTVYLNADGTVSEVRLGEPSSEDDLPYLMMLKISDRFLPQFAGKGGEITPEEIDTVTYATLSSKAVLEAVNAVLSQAKKAPAAPSASVEGDAATVTARGFTGTFDVTVTLDENGAVASVKVGKPSTEQDEPYLQMVKDSKTFLAQFVGKTGEIAEGDIDTVTYATISSKGILEAVNQVLAGPAQEEPEAQAPAVSVEGNAATVTARGFTGTFDVTVTLDENGAVASVKVGKPSTEQDEPYLQMVKDSKTFLAQFVGKTGEIAEGDIDTVTYATISSKGILEAVNQVLSAHGAQ